MIELTIFRHGETDWNAEHRFQGHMDIPLNNKGREQAIALGNLLCERRIEAILSSDLSRAMETAERVAQICGGIPVVTTTLLREAFLGDAQGKTLAEIEVAFGPILWKRWRSNDVTDADVSYPGGESGNQVMTRSFEAMEKFIVQNPQYRKIGISTHGGVIRRVMQRILPSGSHPVAIPNTVAYRLEYESGQWYSKDL